MISNIMKDTDILIFPELDKDDPQSPPDLRSGQALKGGYKPICLFSIVLGFNPPLGGQGGFKKETKKLKICFYLELI